MTFYKLFTHNFHSPLQGGPALWDGSCPFSFPTVALDKSHAECGSSGWHFVSDMAAGFRIAGMWPTGRPSAVAIIEPSKDAIERGDKWRASSFTIKRLATEIEIAQGIESLSSVFGEHQKEMAAEQLA